MKTKLHLLFLVLTTSIVFGQTQKAIYKVTFTSVWNEADHGLPNNAHYSRFVGVTHKNVDAFFALGQKATLGIKNIAESGNTADFNSEVNAAIANQEADQYIEASNLPSAVGQVIINDLIVDRDYPRLTLVSMIFPSPDWMIAINGVSFVDSNSNWLQSVNLDLYVYDAGTDSGTDYTSPNQVTNPAEDIHSLKSISPFKDKKIGTLVMTKLKGNLNLYKVELKNSIHLYYDSTKDHIKIHNQNNVNINAIKIYSILGNEVKKEIYNFNDISTHDIKKGLYLFKIVTEKGNIIKKIIK